MDLPDPKDAVRRGYDAVSYHYRPDDAGEGQYGPWITELCDRIPAPAAVLGRRAQQLVPTASFIRADATTATFPAASFDAMIRTGPGGVPRNTISGAVDTLDRPPLNDRGLRA